MLSRARTRARDARARRHRRHSTARLPPRGHARHRRAAAAHRQPGGPAHRWPAHLRRHVCGDRKGATRTFWSRASSSRKPSAGDRTLSTLLAQPQLARRAGLRALRRSGVTDHRRRNSSTASGDAGISLCAFNPLNPLDERFSGVNQRDHRKIVVVDGELAFAGGVNFSQAYHIASKQARHARSLEAEIARARMARHAHRHARHGGAASRAPVSHDLARGGMRGRKCRRRSTSEAASAGNTLVQIVASTPDDDSNEIYATLLSVITYAQKQHRRHHGLLRAR